MTNVLVMNDDLQQQTMGLELFSQQLINTDVQPMSKKDLKIILNAIRIVQESIRQFQLENTALGERILDVYNTEDNAQLAIDYKTLTNTSSQYMTERNEAIEQVHTIRLQLEKMKASLNESKEMIAASKTANTTLKQQKKTLNTEIASQKHTVASLTDQIQVNLSTIRTLEDDLLTAQNQAESVQRNATQLKADFEIEKSKHMEELLLRQTEQKRQLQQAELDYNNAKTAIETTLNNDKADAMNKQKKMYEREIADLTRVHDAALADPSIQKYNATRFRSLEETYTATLNELKTKLANNIKEYTAQFDTQRHEHQEELKSLRNDYERQLTELNKNIESQKRANKSARDVLKSNHARARQDNQDEINRLSANLAAERAKFEHLNDTVDTATASIRSSEGNLHITTNELKRTRSELTQSEENVRIQRININNLEAELKSKDTKIQRLNDKLTGNIQKLEEKESELVQKERDNQDLRDHITTLSNNAITQEENYNSSMTALKEANKLALTQVNQTLEDLRRTHNKLQQTFEDMQSENEKLLAQLPLLQNEINQSIEKIESLEKELTKQKAHNKSVRKLQSDLVVLDQIQEKEESVRENEDIEKIVTTESLIKQLDEQQQSIRELLESLAKMTKSFNNIGENTNSSAGAVAQFSTIPLQYTAHDLGVHLQNKGMIPSRDEIPIVEFDITAERERHRSIIDQLIVLDDSRAFDAMEEYILTSGDIDPAVFVVLDMFAVFVNMVEGSTNSRKNSFWKSNDTDNNNKSIIRDIIEAASSEVEHTHVLDVANFTDIRPVITSLVNQVFKSKYLDTVAENPGSIFAPMKQHPQPTFTFANQGESFNRKQSGALLTPESPVEKLFDTQNQLKHNYNFYDFTRQYVLPVLNQPDKGIIFSLTDSPNDPWAAFKENSSLDQVAIQLSNAIIQHLHVKEVGKRRRRPTRLSVRKLLSDYIISNTLNNVHHSGILYTNTNDKIKNILVSVVHNGFLAAFDYCLNILRVPREFDSPYMYSALQNPHFVDLVALRYNCTAALTQSTRAQISTVALQLAFSNKLDYFQEQSNAIQPLTIPLTDDVYSDAPKSRSTYLSAVTDSTEERFKTQRKRLRRVTRSRTIVF